MPRAIRYRRPASPGSHFADCLPPVGTTTLADHSRSQPESD